MTHIPQNDIGQMSSDDLLTLELAVKARPLTFTEAFRLIDALRSAWDDVEKAEEAIKEAPDSDYNWGFNDGQGEGHADGIETGKKLLALEILKVLERSDHALQVIENVNRVISSFIPDADEE